MLASALAGQPSVVSNGPLVLVAWRKTIRRSATNPPDGGYFSCQAPSGTTLGELVWVARDCTAAGQCIAAAQEQTGLAAYQVRKWDSWYRHVTLSMFALTVLAGARARGVTPVQFGWPA